MTNPLLNGLASIGWVLLAMAAVALVEAVIPLHAPGARGRAHFGPNMALTFITFATNLAMNVLVILGLVWAKGAGVGLLNLIALPPVAQIAIVVLGLDLAFYLAHRAMHAVPGLWLVHAVHHSDPFVDVTTTIRQHPGESLIRYAVIAVVGIGLGAGPAAFAVYRLWSVFNGLFEHANIRLPRSLDRILVLAISTPDMHKIHHSRRPEETDSNYSNITSIWDRLFGTYTPSHRGIDIDYGLDGHDQVSVQTTFGLLAGPFRPGRPRAEEGHGA
jgi:sterol desaturase/sphingolipid hydroxylase (fatty acid hydroxylase superfamily)